MKFRKLVFICVIIVFGCFAFGVCGFFDNNNERGNQRHAFDSWGVSMDCLDEIKRARKEISTLKREVEESNNRMEILNSNMICLYNKIDQTQKGK